MTSGLHFFDTNILLYSISDDPREISKRTVAIELLEREGGAISMQVLQEFYAQATRTKLHSRATHDQACDLIAGWMRFRIQEITVPVFELALDIRGKHGFAIWDCFILSAAQSLGCEILYTEDLTHGWTWGDLRVINPFV